jgi:hypothetical protein
MQLVDRYLQAVKPLLPKAQQADILQELQANILSEMDDRESELGRSLTEDEQIAILKRQGSPTLVASRYRQDQRSFTFGRVIIGPTVFPMYARILTLNVCITLFLASFVHVLVEGKVNFPTLLFPLLLQFIVITAVFAGIEHATKNYNLFDRWNPRELPPARDPLKISRANTLFEMFFTALSVLCLLRIPGAAFAVLYMFVGPVAHSLVPYSSSPFVFSPGWQVYYIPILLLLFATIAQQGLNFAFPRWTRNRLIVRVALAALGLVINICLFRAGDAILVNSDVANAAQYAELFRLVNVCVHYGMLFGAIGSVWDIGWQIRRIVRLTPEQTPSHSASVAC